MIEAIEKLAQVDLSSFNELGDSNGKALHGPVEDINRIIEAIKEVQEEVPEDLEGRREAAREFLDFNLADAHFPFAKLEFEIIKREGLDPAERKACKRVLGIFKGPFEGEGEEEYYPPSPDYPEFWVQGGPLSENDAKFLYSVLQQGESAFEDPMVCYSASTNLVSKGFVWQEENIDPEAPRFNVYANRAPFECGLELPGFVDQEEL